MSLFARHYLGADAETRTPPTLGSQLTADEERRMGELAAIICDEEAALE
jgi:hypothetical protein